jgi:hypothetical protein
MQGVVESYEDVVVTTKKRFVHVLEDVTAHIEAWHGGRLVTELGGWSSVQTAVRGAAVQAQRFRVTDGSTMSILVREEVSRRRVIGDKVDLDHRGETIGRTAVVAERYVHDAVLGELASSWRTVSFEWIMPILFAKATDWPGECLPEFFRLLTIEGWDRQFLYGGYGYRNVKAGASTSRPARAGEMPEHAMVPRMGRTPSPSQCWVVVVNGSLEVSAPPERSDAEVLADLATQHLRVDVELDQVRDSGRMNRDRWEIYTGVPAAKLIWQVPPLARSSDPCMRDAASRLRSA